MRNCRMFFSLLALVVVMAIGCLAAPLALAQPPTRGAPEMGKATCGTYHAAVSAPEVQASRDAAITGNEYLMSKETGKCAIIVGAGKIGSAASNGHTIIHQKGTGAWVHGTSEAEYHTQFT